jgi:uncharacterized protein YjbI with pentapeptide repeats
MDEQTTDRRVRTRGGSRSRAAVIVFAVVLAGAGLTGCLTTPGDLAGTVRNTDGTPLAGIVVTLRDGVDAVVATTTTDVDGTYELLDVAPGVLYTVGMDDGAGPYLDWWHAGASSLAAATPVAIGDGATTVVDATLVTPATAAAIAGTVTDGATTAPVAGLAVAVLAPGTTSVLASATTAVDGTYQVTGLSPGSYVVRYGPTPPYAASYSGDARSVGSATAVAATAGGTTVADGTVRRSGRITGTARTATTIGVDFPVPGIRVIAVVPGDVAHPVAVTTSGADGSYQLTGLPPGPILVGFVDGEGVGGLRGFAPAFFNTPRQADPASATSIAVTEGATRALGPMRLTGADCDPAAFGDGSSGGQDHYEDDLSGARLAGCTFGWGSSYHLADLSGADLSRMVGVNVGANGASFAGARVSDVDVSGGTFTDADFRGADLRRTSLSALSSPVGSLPMDLSRADFSDADLTGARFTNANLTDVVWSNTTCPDATNSDANGGTCLGHGVT